MQYNLRVQTSLVNKSNFPEDVITNTWYFGSDKVGWTRQQAAQAAVDRLDTFYDAITAVISGDVLDTIQHRVYDLNDPQPRQPIAATTSNTVFGTAAGLPYECAIVLSFKSFFLSGATPARHKGRVYLGPIRASASTTTNGGVRPTAAAMTAIANAATTLRGAGSTADPLQGVVWCQFSAADADPTVGDGMRQVVAGWVDDAFDTQRRRGLHPTARTVF